LTGPTPAGVPLKMRSPGCSVISFERYAICSGTRQIIWSRSLCCFLAPLTLSQIAPLSGCPISLEGCNAVHGADSSKLLPISHDRPAFFASPCRSRRVMSRPTA
jgi:hypothetical protein